MASFFGGSSQGLIVISGLNDDALVAGAVDEEKIFHDLGDGGSSRLLDFLTIQPKGAVASPLNDHCCLSLQRAQRRWSQMPASISPTYW